MEEDFSFAVLPSFFVSFGVEAGMAGFAFGIMISVGFSSAEGGENGGISGGGPKDGSKGAAGAGADAGEGAGNAFLREMIFFKLSTSFSSWLTLSARAVCRAASLYAAETENSHFCAHFRECVPFEILQGFMQGFEESIQIRL